MLPPESCVKPSGFSLSAFQLLLHRSRKSLLEKAIAIAVEAHRGQKDKSGAPCILHPLRVMTRVTTEDEQIVAILHDVVEDTPWTFEKLAAEGFPQHILRTNVRRLSEVTEKDRERLNRYLTAYRRLLNK
jgi:(p)ppGpp synthase/HD superfamily hydrolase